MRIFMLYGPGEIAKELCRRGYEVLTVACDIEGELEPDAAKFLTNRTVRGRMKLSPFAINDVRKLTIEFQPDIIHAFTNFSLAWANLATIRLPYGVPSPKIHSFRGITAPVSRWDLANWFTFRNNQVAAHACESHAVRESMIESGFDIPEDAVVYNCVPRPIHSLSREQARAELGVPADAFVIGSIATVRPVKGLDILLQAALLLEHPNIHFVVIGPGHYEGFDFYARSPSLKDRLHCPGGIHDAKRMLSAFDLFVMPSRSEGLCRALIEAMQYGLPSVVSDAGGMKELVRNNVDGLVVQRENPSALANAIHRLHVDSDLRHWMGQSAMKQVDSICAPHVVVDKLLHIYRQSLGQQLGCPE
ncbi:MAG: glycosyltransferase family 4 protein [Planctomycetota bacterium]